MTSRQGTGRELTRVVEGYLMGEKVYVKNDTMQRFWPCFSDRNCLSLNYDYCVEDAYALMHDVPCSRPKIS